MAKLRTNFASAKRTIMNYRKMIADLQTDFFKSGSKTVPSTTSDITAPTKINDRSVGDETMSNTGYGRDDSFSGIDDQSQISKPMRAAVRATQRHQRGSSHTVKVNYNLICDIERFERFKLFVTALADCKKSTKVMLVFLEQIRNIVQCSIGSVFVFKPEYVVLRELHRNLSA
jgi:hypothetical protein